jgi:hypothetical protein
LRSREKLIIIILIYNSHLAQIYLLKLTSTLSQYLEGAPIEKKTITQLVRRASLNAVPFDFKKDFKQPIAERDHEEHSMDLGETLNSVSRDDDLTTSQQTPYHQRLFGLASPLVDQSPFHLSHLTSSIPHSSPSSQTIQTQSHAFHSPASPSHLPTPSRYSVDVPTSASSDRNPCNFIHLENTLEDQCDYLFYRIYTLSHPNYLPNEKIKDYHDSKREVLTEWIGKKTFLSMCLALDIIDDRLTIQAAANSFDKAAQEAMRSQYKLNSRCERSSTHRPCHSVSSSLSLC